MRNYLRKLYRVRQIKRDTAKVEFENFCFFSHKEEILFTFFLFFFFNTCAQVNNNSKKEAATEIKFSGFIKYELFADTRQTVNAREGLVVLYPENVLMDLNNNDVNAKSSVNMLSINSRLRCNISGPVLLGAKSSGLVEADFYGNENRNFSDLNGLRMFNAYMKFKWSTTELLVGQYWHPMSVPEFFPAVISFNAGAPFHPMSRNPQIRLVQSIGMAKLIGCLFSQRDFTGTGPDGPGSQYLRNSGLPNMHFMVQSGTDSSKFSAGTGIDYKKIVPELFTVNDEEEIFETKKSLTSISFVGFINAKTQHLTFRAQCIYSRNAYDILMIGGYAVKKVSNAQTGEMEFSNLNTLSGWGDVQSTGSKIHFGVFGAYSKNMGAGEFIDGPFYTRGADIGSVYRISPRIVYTIRSLDIALEEEYTNASYGTVNGNMKGGVTVTKSVSNIRSLLSLKYSF